MLDIFAKTGINDLSYALDTLSEKNRQISRNIAHSDTPWYKGTKLVFNEVMEEYFSASSSNADRLYTTGAGHIQIAAGRSLDNLFVTDNRHMGYIVAEANPADFVRFQNNPSTRTDGNDVNLDYEMSELAAASIQYNMFAEIIGNKFTTLKDVLRTR